MGLQQHSHPRWRSMESGLQNKLWTLRTNGHVLWIMQLPSKLPGNDGQYLWRYDKQLYHYCLHGQHFPLRNRHGNMATLTENTRKVLQCLRDNDLFLKATKCEFNKTKIEYLGMIIEENKIYGPGQTCRNQRLA